MSASVSASVLDSACGVRRLKLLSIGAHPADVFDQCGGTLAHHAARGDSIACISLTHGARIHDKVVADEMQHAERIPDAEAVRGLIADRSDVKTEEIRAAGRILGFSEVYFLGEDDDILMVTKENVRAVTRLIRKIRPDVILTHFPDEGDGVANPHAVCGRVVLHAIQFANAIDPGDHHPPHRIAQVFFFGEGAAHLPRNVFEANRYYYNDVIIDITDVIEKKLAAMDCLVSQGYGGVYARKRLETSDGAFGAGYAYGEGFIRMKAENHHYLPVPEKLIETATLSDHDLMSRYSWRMKVD